ncbi:Glutaminyl-peptide cyclotransferase [Phytophthora citrophthora]|uniref:Glutaminyl-peptide cyclotransferase n=1 Tax=Phytophthora citrophthora TaxID=4793 RepID=A0AAD9LTM1_9STRA|nr:Glutaminyl-peptide cyclotransferase [Phytophthora citrophthora]
MPRRLLHLATLLTCLSHGDATGDSLQPTAVRLVTIHPHNVSAFTEGLVFADGALIESTGLHGESFIRQYKLSDLKPDLFKVSAVQSVPLLQEFRFNPAIFGEGVTVLGDKLFALTYKAEQVLVLSRHDFQLVGQFPLTTSTKEGWGLTTDGEFLIASDGSANVQFFDPHDDFKLHHSITVRKDGKAVTNVNELEYVEGELLANVWFEDHILRIDIETGDVLEQIDLDWIPSMVPNLHTEAMKMSPYQQDAVMNGIAYDPVSRHVFVTGKLWDSMFELELSYLSAHNRHIVP